MSSLRRPLWVAVLLWAIFHGFVKEAALAIPRTALLQPAVADEAQLTQLQLQGYAAVALVLSETNRAETTLAAARIAASSLALDYWIDVARNPALADARPEWMASIQTHQEWRRRFPTFGPCPTNAIVKAYPWTPVLYRESFPVHLERVAGLLRNRPAPRRLYLNGLQGPPSACGCGHPLCRWTADYGPLRSATHLTARAATDFLVAVKQLRPGLDVIPVWTTECERADRDTVCGGVGCFGGACWREWTAQLTPLENEAPTIGVLLLPRVFDRELARYGPPFGWISSALESFQSMPPRYQAKGVPIGRLMPVLQGWDVIASEIEAQVARAAEAGSRETVVAFAPLDQSWEPRLFELQRSGK